MWVLIPTHGEVHLIQLPLCDKFGQIWGGGQFFFSQGILVSSTNKIDHQDKQNNWIIGDRTDQHDIQNHWIMLKVAYPMVSFYLDILYQIWLSFTYFLVVAVWMRDMLPMWGLLMC